MGTNLCFIAISEDCHPESIVYPDEQERTGNSFPSLVRKSQVTTSRYSNTLGGGKLFSSCGTLCADESPVSFSVSSSCKGVKIISSKLSSGTDIFSSAGICSMGEGVITRSRGFSSDTVWRDVLEYVLPGFHHAGGIPEQAHTKKAAGNNSKSFFIRLLYPIYPRKRKFLLPVHTMLPHDNCCAPAGRSLPL